LGSATGFTTKHQSARDKQQEDACSEHEFSLRAILNGDGVLQANVERRTQEGFPERAVNLQSQDPDREAEGKRRREAAFSFI
jgi:hypothetical protein